LHIIFIDFLYNITYLKHLIQQTQKQKLSGDKLELTLHQLSAMAGRKMLPTTEWRYLKVMNAKVPQVGTTMMAQKP
jgi:hypothetical protein